MDIRKELGNRIIFLDGGMGTLLQERGLSAGEKPESWNLSRPQDITDIHRLYLRAGADVILTNTFGANRFKYCEGLEEVIASAVGNARAAVIAEKPDALVALDIGPTGKLLKPVGTLDFEDAVAAFSEVIQIGASSGVDLIVIETMSDCYELKAAVIAAKESSSLPIFASAAFGENGKTLTGTSPQGLVALLEGLGVDALGLNCGLGPEQMKDICSILLEKASIPVLVSPNAGLPRVEDGKTVFDVTPEEFSDEMLEIAKSGACILGGCCGTTPEHIRLLREKCEALPVIKARKKELTVVTSCSAVVELGREPVIIGERINPTGKPKFKQALRERDIQYILTEAVRQSDAGAHILDVNVGLPEIDEPEMMADAVSAIQAVLPLPLQIDSSDCRALERAMRIYNGKPMINSVNGKKESMDSVFPLVKKYGGVVVGLTLDEGGIPDTADGRLDIAHKIIETAESCGISRSDIVIDALTMTVSTDAAAAEVTLETVRRLHAEGIKTVLGVSNVSFGLPCRSIVNSAFFLLALREGLSAAIVNPLSPEMMQSFDSHRVLSGLDRACSAYISKYASASASAQTTQDKELSLADCVAKGLSEKAYLAAKVRLETVEPMSLITGELVPALDAVGKQFERGTLFLPQLLMSAEAAKAGFNAVREQLAKTGSQQIKKETVVIATVKGDIHDIGKNIVRVLLENYGYNVIDLGKDVAPQTVLDAVTSTGAPYCCLSALMTTTVVSMEETVRLLHAEAPGCIVMVGGAVLTQEYADMIGADFYGKDAMQSVNFLEGRRSND